MTLRTIQASLRAGIAGRAERVGPFLVSLSPDTDNLFRNYAVPDDDATPTRHDVAALVAYFVGHSRAPRLEYVTPAPKVTKALTAQGFTVERELPLMVLDSLSVPSPPPGAQLLLATTEPELHACAAVQNAAYGGGDASPPDPPSEADVDRLRRLVAAGGAVGLALLDGEPASSGVVSQPQDGLAEVAAIGTLTPFRQRGLAAAVAALVSRFALDHGAVPYLQAEGENEARMYARLGFRRVGALALVNGPAR